MRHLPDDTVRVVIDIAISPGDVALKDGMFYHIICIDMQGKDIDRSKAIALPEFIDHVRLRKLILDN